MADYFLAIHISQAQAIRRRKQLLSLSIGINLGILAIFKYADFAIQSVSELLAVIGYEASFPVLSFLLPVGISFYTFQSMSYTIDVYRGQMEPRKGLLQFTAALAFFPQLVAGPILRARQILPQLEKIPIPDWPGVKHGFLLITVGLFKKTLADLLAGRVDAVFGSTGPVSLLEAWTGVLAFAAQIYGDFSGYTDMAIGIALLLGFKIPINFRLPYFATSPVDFWRRWHISLSSWLRDYLYISLGGNRNHRYRNYDVAGWAMAWGGLDFYRLGLFSRLFDCRHALAILAFSLSKPRRIKAMVYSCSNVDMHVLSGTHWMGILQGREPSVRPRNPRHHAQDCSWYSSGQRRDAVRHIMQYSADPHACCRLCGDSLEYRLGTAGLVVLAHSVRATDNLFLRGSTQ